MSAFPQTDTDHSHKLARSLKFPNVPGYTVMKCDLHMHTVFSDGSVWPDIRVAEALMDGLDAISLTEHLEYQPHKNDIPHPDRNRSYELALKEARITRTLLLDLGLKIKVLIQKKGVKEKNLTGLKHQEELISV